MLKSNTDVRQHPCCEIKYFHFTTKIMTHDTIPMLTNHNFTHLLKFTRLALSPQLSHQHKPLLDDTWQEQELLS